MQRSVLIVVFGFFFLANAAATQKFACTPIPSDNEVREMLKDWTNRRQPDIGIVAGIIGPTGRRIIAYGKPDAHDPHPLDGDSIFEIGSITKVFTSLLLADMVQHGEVALTDPVSRYLPKEAKVPGRHGRAIALEDLSRHRSGLPRMPLNFPPMNPKDAYRRYSPRDLYRFLAMYPLPRDIGSQFEYSNLGVGMLGYALSLAAGKNYEELLRTRILEPLRMNSTAITLSPDLRARMVPGYSMWFDPGPNWDIGEVFAGAGGLSSTANDLLSFLAAQIGETDAPLKSAIVLTRSSWQPAYASTAIGLGWLKVSAGGKEIICHNGATGSYCAFAGFDPATKTGAVVLTNLATPLGEAEDVGFRLLGLSSRPSPPWSLLGVVGMIGTAILIARLREQKSVRFEPVRATPAKHGFKPSTGLSDITTNNRPEEQCESGAVPRPAVRGEMPVAMDSPPDTMIDVRDLFFSYQSIEVLHGISFQVRRGELIGLLGPNGAGKSTTLKILAGILPTNRGKVQIAGYPLPEQHLEAKRVIGYLPEAPLVYECLSGTEFLEFLGRLQGLEERILQDRIRVLLEAFELNNVRVPRISAYSKGMRQKILLSAALLHNPDILLLDEPLSGLDVKTSILIKDLLSALSAEGKTILYSSHVLDVVEKVCHRILVIDHGSLIADAPLDELKSRTSEKSLEDIFRILTHAEDTKPKVDRVLEVLKS
jgi:ABC-type multidrug transport system ATPase subunit/CubicO group peptidase (beta-lactamase class C family)